MLQDKDTSLSQTQLATNHISANNSPLNSRKLQLQSTRLRIFRALLIPTRTVPPCSVVFPPCHETKTLTPRQVPVYDLTAIRLPGGRITWKGRS